MTQQFATPGVYIEEVTGPGVIAGVSTSTAAFIGPATRGPINQPRRISSMDEFIGLYGTTLNRRPWPYLHVGNQWYYLGFGVEGFFTNQGQQAYIVRVGTAVQAALTVKNQGSGAVAPQDVFTVRALQDGILGNQIQVAIEHYNSQPLAAATATVRTVTVQNPTSTAVTVDNPAGLQAGDFVQIGAGAAEPINHVQGYDLFFASAPAGTVADATLRIADIPPARLSFRLASAAGISAGLAPAGGMALIGTDDAFLTTTTAARVVVQSADAATNRVTLAPTPAKPALSLAGAPPTLTSVRLIAHASSAISAITTVTGLSGILVSQFTAASPELFRPGDLVTSNGTATARIGQIRGSTITLDSMLNPLTSPLRTADIAPNQTTFRIADTTGLYAGTVVLLRGDDAAAPGTQVQDHVVIQAVNGAGFVTLEAAPPTTHTYSAGTSDTNAPILIPEEFRLIITPPALPGGVAPLERIENLSLDPLHPRYILAPGLVQSNWITIDPPAFPPTTLGYPARLVPLGGPTPLAAGKDDDLGALTAADYQQALDVLRDVDGINMVCIPDAAANPDHQTIQLALVDHCQQRRDRVAILDSLRDAPPTGPGSVETQRLQLKSASGFAALYYPWLLLRNPLSSGPVPETLLVPPSGHMAGIWARTDAERGVHKAPANTDVRGVLGLERRLSDRQQGPLNLEGINVLRIFPGSGTVTVWGGRTTVDPIITDWLYLSTRRLMIFIEQSIEVGIRWAVFEPNNLSLWKKLKREIKEFLTRVWKDGALFGENPDKAFYVRIDEGLNPPSTRALGQLYIEIGVAVVRPAEFIIVRIGLWDGGAEISD